MNQDQLTDLVLQSQSGDDAAMEQLLLLAHVPVYLLECLPNADAVALLQSTLFEG